MISVDTLIAGSGLTGAVIGRMLSDAGREVLIVDRRSHAGGNVHDHAHESGIRIHTYGPHYFRTSSEKIWTFVNRFAQFHPYEACVKSLVDGALENWPVAANYIRRTIGEGWSPEFKGTPSNFEEAALSMMPRVIYEKFVKEYNEKQWGVPAHTLSRELCARFDVREDDDPRLKPDAKYQGIPREGYAEMMRRMLDGIPLMLDVDYLRQRDAFHAKKLLVFTGPLDEFFGYDLGKLAYRGQQRSHTYLPGTEYAQPFAQVNAPLHSQGPHLRTLEWKRMMAEEEASRIRGTVLTTETPHTPENPGDYEYPFPDAKNAKLYKAYRERADGLERTLICGRLGDYRYYDMDQAIGRAMMLAEKILAHG